MRRFIFYLVGIVLGLFIAQYAFAQDFVYFKKKAAGGGSPDYSGITLFWRAENVQMGAGDTYATDSLWTLTSLAAINTDAAYTGTNGLDCPTSSDYAALTNNGEYVTSSSAGRIGFMLRIVTWVDEVGLIAAGNSTDGITINESVTDGEILVQYKGNTDVVSLTTSGSAVNDGNWHFIEVMWNQSTPRMEIFIDGVSRGISTAAMSAMSGAPPGDIQVGSWGDLHFDTVIISTDSATSLYGLKDATSAP